MIRRPPISTRTDTLFPYTTLFRSDGDRSHTRSGGQAVNPARVFLVDDHQMFRSGVRAELGDGVVVVGEAANVESAVAGIRATHPEVVLLDVHLPGGGGKAVLETIRHELPEVVFLALSVSDAAEDVIAVIRAGARGYVTKTISSEELARSIQRRSEARRVGKECVSTFRLRWSPEP